MLGQGDFVLVRDETGFLFESGEQRREKRKQKLLFRLVQCIHVFLNKLACANFS